MSDRKAALIVAGPTCSGKSALALALAQHFGGTVINADAMQVYRDLRVLTARPSAAEESVAPHRLYGIRAAAEPGSVAWWRRAALDAMAAARDEGRLPILCGGSGMYLHALVRGIADIPDPGPAREEARAMLAALGAEAMHACLVRVDPVTAAALSRGDGQRVARAWEVWRATGEGLVAWQRRLSSKPGWRYAALMLDPPRDELRAAIARRFAGMLAAGALDEVVRLQKQALDPALPIMRAHGVPELMAHLEGVMTLDEASMQACLATGRYTRRQATWFRHHPVASTTSYTINARIAAMQQLSTRQRADIANFVAVSIDAAELEE